MRNLERIAVPAFLAVRESDGAFRYQGANLANERWSGIGQQSLVGRTPSEVVGGTTADRLLPYYHRCLNERVMVEFEASTLLATGPTHWRTLLIPISGPDGAVDSLLGLSLAERADTRLDMDVTVLNRHLDLAIRSLKGADWRYDVLRDRFEASPNLALLLGEAEPRDVPWSEWEARIFPEDLPSCSCSSLLSGEVREQDIRFRFRGRGGETRWAKCRRIMAVSSPGPVVCGVVTDISEEVAREQKLLEEASSDSLTRLLNRRAFRQHCDALEARASDASSLAVIMLDLDDFKRINDRFGHPVGDEVLVEVARRLVSVIGPGAAIARLGGDEFVAAVSDLPERDANRLVETVGAALRRPLQRAETSVAIGGSVGLCWRPEARDVRGMIAEADDRLYRIKRARKQRSEPDADRQISLFAA